jgi:hypothetical protein
MYKRVIVPALVAVGACAGTAAFSFLGAMMDTGAIRALARGEARWTVPAVGNLGWLLFLVVFFAVRLCALRGGSRRERWAVGLAPLVLALVCYGAVAISIGPSALMAAAGITTGVVRGQLTISSVIAIRNHAAYLVGLAGTCIAATWLCLFVMGEREGVQQGVPDGAGPERA